MKNLAVVDIALGQCFKLCGLHIQFGGGTSHAHHLGSFFYFGNIGMRLVIRGGFDVCIDDAAQHAFGIAGTDNVKHQRLGGGHAVYLMGDLDLGQHQCLAHREYGIAVGVHVDIGGIVFHDGIRRTDTGGQQCAHRLDIDGIVVDFHGCAVAGSGTARQLVDGRGHGTDLDDTFVYIVAQQSGSGGLGNGCGERCAADLRAIGALIGVCTHCNLVLDCE